MKLQKIFRSEWSFPIILSAIAILVSLIPLFHRYLATPKDKFFNGTYFYSDDYGYYASVIQQGIDGKWLVSDKYTSEPHDPSVMHGQYLILGKLGKILNLSSPVTFHLGRALGGFFFLIATYLLIQEVFLKKSHRYLAFLATFLASGIPYKIIDGSRREVIQIPAYWFTELNPFERLTPLFHYSLAWILLFIIFITFIKFIKNYGSKLIILASTLGIFVSVPHPSTLPIIYITFIIFIIFITFITLISHAKRLPALPVPIAKTALFLLIFAISTLPILFYLKAERLKFPWNSHLLWEKIFIADLPLVDYALSIGPAFFFGIMGAILFFKELLNKRTLENSKFKINNSFEIRNSKFEINDAALLLIISYVISVFLLLYPLQNYIGVNRVRVLQTPIHVPFAILATFVIIWLVELFKKKLANPASFARPGLAIRITYAGFLITLLFTFIPVFSATLPYITHLFDDFSPLTYPTKKMVEAYNFLNKNTSHDKVILSTYIPGNQIPYMASNTVFLGHLYNTVNFYKKGEAANLFYQGKMTKDEAQRFLSDNRISYVFYGPQERGLGTLENYPFLKKIFDNGEVSVFE